MLKQKIKQLGTFLVCVSILGFGCKSSQKIDYAKLCAEKYPCITKDSIIKVDTQYIEHDTLITHEVKVSDVLCDSASQIKKVEVPVEKVVIKQGQTITNTKVIYVKDSAEINNLMNSRTECEKRYTDKVNELNQLKQGKLTKLQESNKSLKKWINVWFSISLLLLIIAGIIIYYLGKSSVIKR